MVGLSQDYMQGWRVDGKRSYALMQRHLVSSPPRSAALLRRLRFSASRTAELGEVDEDEEEDCRLKKSAPWTLLPGVLAGGAAFWRTGEVGKEPWPESTLEMLECLCCTSEPSPESVRGNRAGGSCGRRDIERDFAEEVEAAWRGGGGASLGLAPPGPASVQEARRVTSGGSTRR